MNEYIEDRVSIDDYDEYPFDLEINVLPSPNLRDPLTFELVSGVYRLQFERWTRPNIKHPFTTVNLLMWDDAEARWWVYRTATVGCYHRDVFTHEDGRKAALRSLMPGLRGQRALKQAIWATYLSRTGK